MTDLPDPSALLQMARALGLHAVPTREPDSEAIALVRVYRTVRDHRAVVTWEPTRGIVCRRGLSWAPCSRAEAAAILRAVALEPSLDDYSEPCNCEQAVWWQREAARLARELRPSVTPRLQAALVRLLWRSIADDAMCTCDGGDTCPECDAWRALALGGAWPGSRTAEDVLTTRRANQWNPSPSTAVTGDDRDGIDPANITLVKLAAIRAERERLEPEE